MRQSESIAKLAAALVKAQAEVENATKNASNPHFKSRYADLAEILNTVKPVFTKHGLAIMQLPGLEEGHATVETRLVHESGEWIESTSGAPLQKQDPQGVGSAITYLRRYSLAALAGIAQEDDDGNAASSTNGNGGYVKLEFVTDKQVADLQALMDEVGADKAKFLQFLGVPALDRLQKIEYPKALRALERKREGATA